MQTNLRSLNLALAAGRSDDKRPGIGLPENRVCGRYNVFDQALYFVIDLDLPPWKLDTIEDNLFVHENAAKETVYDFASGE